MTDRDQEIERLMTISYDQNLYIFDIRSTNSPLASVNLGGGIWRIKWKYDDPSRILTAAMHNGFHVVKFNSEDTICTYLTHLFQLNLCDY